MMIAMGGYQLNNWYAKDSSMMICSNPSPMGSPNYTVIYRLEFNLQYVYLAPAYRLS